MHGRGSQWTCRPTSNSFVFYEIVTLHWISFIFWFERVFSSDCGRWSAVGFHGNISLVQRSYAWKRYRDKSRGDIIIWILLVNKLKTWGRNVDHYYFRWQYSIPMNTGSWSETIIIHAHKNPYHFAGRKSENLRYYLSSCNVQANLLNPDSIVPNEIVRLNETTQYGVISLSYVTLNSRNLNSHNFFLCSLYNWCSDITDWFLSVTISVRWLISLQRHIVHIKLIIITLHLSIHLHIHLPPPTSPQQDDMHCYNCNTVQYCLNVHARCYQCYTLFVV